MARKGKDNEGEISSGEFENIPGTDDYIEFLGEVDDEFGNIPGTDDYVEELGDFMFNLNVGETGEVDCDNIGRDDEDDSDSDDDSYMEHSESGSECCDSEESLVDDYEIHEDLEDRFSDEDEGNFSAALQNRVSRRESDGSEKMASFTLGMTFLDRDENAKLEANCNELKVSNPGSDVSVELSGKALDQGMRVFRRMYVCFNASKSLVPLSCYLLGMLVALA
ncbi:hypothetical protein K1719_008575 [Acacia pycnantha]|nr:hypothetical protein K1719_008575 [Acacia pycnantha]